MTKAKIKLPDFKSEAEEATWWAQNPEALASEFERAAAEGRLGHGRVAKRAALPTTTIRLDPADIERARVQAERRGLKYQTYLKMLLHEALKREERKAAV